MRKTLLFLALLICLPPSFAAPRLAVQGDDKYLTDGMIVSNGGRWVACPSWYSESICLWDARSGLIGLQIPTLSDEKPLLFTPDATRLITVVPVKDGKLWYRVLSVPSGRFLATLKLSGTPVWCSDREVLARAEDKISKADLRTGDLRSVKTLAGFQGFDVADHTAYEYSANGNYFLGQGPKGLRWWRTSDGRCLGAAPSPRALSQCAISNDGQWLASEVEPEGWVYPQEGPNGEAPNPEAFEHDTDIDIWRTRDKKLIRTLPGYFYGGGKGVDYLEFSPDSKTLLTAGPVSLPERDGASRWDLSTGKRSKSRLPSLGDSAAISADGRSVAYFNSRFYDSAPMIWNVAAEKPLVKFASPLATTELVAWSPDGRYIAAATHSPAIIDARSGAVIRQLPFYGEPPLAQLNWLNNSTLVVTSQAGDLTCFDIHTGKAKQFKFDGPEFRGYKDGRSLPSFTVSPDAKTALLAISVEKEALLEVWDLDSRRLIRKTKLEPGFYPYNLPNGIWLSKTRVILQIAGGMCIFDVPTHQVVKRWTLPDSAKDDPNAALTPLSIDPAGTKLAVKGPTKDALTIYALPGGEALAQTTVENLQSATMPGDGHTVVFEDDLSLGWRDLSDGLKNEHRRIFISQDSFRSKGWSLSPKGNLLAFGREGEAGFKIFDVASEKERVQLAYASENDWFAVLPNGHYNASPAGERRLRWYDASGFWPLQKSRTTFRRPARVKAALLDK